MSTNHTPNCNLSLWEPEDQVTRTEFNENHAKIDAILGEAHDRAGMKLIREKVLQEETTSFTVSLEDIDWSDYSIACLDYYPCCPTGGKVLIHIAGFEAGTATAVRLDVPLTPYHTQFWFFPLFEKYSFALSMTLGLDGEVNSSIRTITPNNITHANMTAKYSSSPLAPGSKIRVFGMK